MVSFYNVKKVVLANGAVLIQAKKEGEVVVYWNEEIVATFANWDWALSGYRYALEAYLQSK